MFQIDKLHNLITMYNTMIIQNEIKYSTNTVGLTQTQEYFLYTFMNIGIMMYL